MKKRKILITLFVAVMLTTSLAACGNKEEQTVKTEVAKVENEIPEIAKLERNNWSENTYNALVKLIDENGINSDSYDATKKPYAVFDWDNTSIFNDVQESLLIYQLRNLEFNMTPEEFSAVIRTDITNENFSEDCNNKDGKPVNMELIGADIDSDYKFLYENYEGFFGKLTLDEIKETAEYQDFVVKTRYLYYAIGETFSSDISYPWVTYLATGMTAAEVMDISEKSIDLSLATEISDEVLESPATLPGKAGVVSVKIHNGLRTLPEQQNLYKTLMANGIDTYVVSASFIDVVKTFATNPKYGYNIPMENVYAMELDRKDDKIIPMFREGYPQTQGVGKTETINKYIAVNHQNQAPIMVAGDSGGDYNMLVDFDTMQLGLIVNKLKTGNLGELSKEAAESIGKPDAKYFLQGRDDNAGTFRQGEETIVLGATEGKLVK